MRFRLIPREEKFFDMFDEASAILNRAADKFLDMVTTFDRLHERSAEIKDDEHACDQVVARIIQALDRTFITPLDREDIHTLATRLDDILEAATGRLTPAVRLCSSATQTVLAQSKKRRDSFPLGA
jgi:uncharacterized protein Yka (UPF0111/DUF47 family)